MRSKKNFHIELDVRLHLDRSINVSDSSEETFMLWGIFGYVWFVAWCFTLTAQTAWESGGNLWAHLEITIRFSNFLPFIFFVCKFLYGDFFALSLTCWIIDFFSSNFSHHLELNRGGLETFFGKNKKKSHTLWLSRQKCVRSVFLTF